MLRYVVATDAARLKESTTRCETELKQFATQEKGSVTAPADANQIPIHHAVDCACRSYRHVPNHRMPYRYPSPYRQRPRSSTAGVSQATFESQLCIPLGAGTDTFKGSNWPLIGRGLGY